MQSVKFDTADEIFDDSVRRCSPAFLPEFLEWRVSQSGQANNPHTILLMMSTLTSDRVFCLGFGFIDRESRPDAMKSFFKLLGDPGRFLELATRMKRLNLIDEEEYKGYQSLGSGSLVTKGGLQEQYQALVQAERKGLTVDPVMKCRIVTAHFCEERHIKLAEFSVPRAWEELEAKRAIRNDKELMELATCWKDGGELTPDIAVGLCGISSEAGLTWNRDFWSVALTEETEHEVLRHTSNYAFGLSSKWESVRARAKQMIQNLPQLADSVIQVIIERQETHEYVGTAQFPQIVQAARNLKQVEDIYRSLEAHGQYEAIIDFLVMFFHIPRALANSADAPAIMDYARGIMKL